MLSLVLVTILPAVQADWQSASPGPAPPGPSPPPGPVSMTRLTVVNGCSSEPLWIAHEDGGSGPDPQDLKIEPSQSARFHTSNGTGALSATRFWPKMGCDATGNNCAIGGSGGSGEGCVVHAPGKADDYSHCAPPFDTKFEASFAAPGNTSMDVVDMSLVDGWSLPFKLQTTGGTCMRQTQPFQEMDCSGVSLQHCPAAEEINGKTVDLRARNPKTGQVVGCMSPCMKLIDTKWNTTSSVAADSPEAGPYCCAGADDTPDTCNAGPILQTQYVRSVKAACPAAYSYAYDDKVATISCTSSTEYTVTFYCPTAADELQVFV
eukprot:TRINITY_DN5207_c0_g2_i1.p1 TRINITY_DN5207_c0_g2~~TRINITY_DN5207_c0_g2_i1.p1  ORF type:complete len:341 (+),score=48.11 TRINITY_DN5207_c0_g2_i1:65-1024(+)